MLFHSLYRKNGNVSLLRFAFIFACLIYFKHPKDRYSELKTHGKLCSKSDSVLILYSKSFDFELLEIRTTIAGIIFTSLFAYLCLLSPVKTVGVLLVIVMLPISLYVSTFITLLVSKRKRDIEIAGEQA